jgi:hypothetical protein
MSTSEEILMLVQSGSLTIEQAQKQLKYLTPGDAKKITYKVSTKGAISVYGIRRMPITLYKEEFQKIVDIGNSEEFKAFVRDNSSKLSTKEHSSE